jgi:hypothetical protein
MNPTTETPDLQPASYTDAKGREWHLALSFVKLRTIRDQIGVDLGKLQNIGRAWAELLFDDEKSLEAVWIAIDPKPDDCCTADSAFCYIENEIPEITHDDWLAAMDGPLLDRARDALKGAIENFTQPLKRNLLLQGMGGVDEGYKLILAEAENQVRKGTAAAVARATAAVRRGRPATNAPGSSDTSTTVGRSGKPTRR